MSVFRHKVSGPYPDSAFYICDTDAEKPSSGLWPGDLCFAIDTGKLYGAVAPTTWKEIGAGSAWSTLIKKADQPNNTAVLADVSELQFTTLPNTQYTIRLRVFGETTAAQDVKYRLTHAGTTTRVRRLIARGAAGVAPAFVAPLSAFDTADVQILGTGVGEWFLSEDIVLQVGASGGLLKMQFAQVTAGAGPTAVHEGSYLEYALS